jgi:UDP-MurNAc hydroxylase
MRATSIGHAGILIESDRGSILCDPWFVPAFFGSWFVFPRNDQLSDDLRDRIEHADYLYVTHLHGDHLDEAWLPDHLRADIPILLPGFPTREQERRFRELGFTNFIRTVDGEEMVLDGGLTIAIHVETSITDGPGGDSAMIVSDGRSRLVNQNDCRTTDLGALRAHGPVDLHWLQYSGAIWYPMVYDLPPARMRALVDAKVDQQFARAMRYVEAIDGRAVVPSAGPPAFLDDDLFGMNVIDGDELSIFPDQREFIARLDATGRRSVLAIPGTSIDVTDGRLEVTHPLPDDDVRAIFERKREYLERYRRDWAGWLAAERARWVRPHTDLVATFKAWWEPLLSMAPTLRAAVGSNVLLRAGDVEIVIDFPAGEVRGYDGEAYDFSFDVARDLVETVVADRAVDWSDKLFLSARFKAWRSGEFNEYVYNFFKSLSVERMRRTEAEAKRKLDPPTGDEPDIELDGWVLPRRCPHRDADLSVFGEIDDAHGDCPVMTCTLHGWRWNLATGECLNAIDRPIRARRAGAVEPTAS